MKKQIKWSISVILIVLIILQFVHFFTIVSHVDMNPFVYYPLFCVIYVYPFVVWFSVILFFLYIKEEKMKKQEKPLKFLKRTRKIILWMLVLLLILIFINDYFFYRFVAGI